MPQLEIEQVRSMIRDSFDNFNKEMVELLYALKEKGCKLILLSDHGKEWVEYIENRHEFMSLFEKAYYSFQYSKTKKDKSIFEDVVNDLNEVADECLFIDDSKINIQNAKDVGLNVILFETYEKLVEDLKNVGILI